MKLCDQYAALLDLYVDGELGAAQMLRVQDHLDTCPACRQYVDDALAIRAAFPDGSEAELPEGFHDAVMAAVAADAAKAKKSRKKVWKSLLPLAACFAVVLLVGRGGAMGSKAESAPAAVAADYAAPQFETESAAPAGSAPTESAVEFTAQAPAAANEPAAKEGSSIQATSDAHAETASRKVDERAYFAVLRWNGDAADLNLPADCPPITLEDGTTGYELTRGDYEALLSRVDAQNPAFSEISCDIDAELALVIIQDE